MTDQWSQIQRLLRDRGYGLGSSGPAHDGVDGEPGELTAAAVLAELVKSAPAVAASTYDRDKMIAELIRDEDERLTAYKDTVGKWSIGIGRNLTDVGIRPNEATALGITTATALKSGITTMQSRFLVNSDLDHVERALDDKLPWWRKLDPVRQRVLVNMCFNMGIATLLGFHNTLALVERGDYPGAAANMLLSKWAKQVGARADRLSEMMKNAA